MKIRWRMMPLMKGYSGKRPWPEGEYENGMPAARIVCKDTFSKELAAARSHAPLMLFVADHSKKPWDWRRAARRFDSLESAKAAAEELLTKYPEMQPKEASEDEI